MSQSLVHVTFKFVNFHGDDKPSLTAMLQVCPRMGELIRFTEPIENINLTDRTHVVRNVVHTVKTKNSHEPFTTIVEIVPVSGFR